MSSRFLRIMGIWALLLATFWLGERIYRQYVFTADEARTVTPAGKLSDWEKSTVELFRKASPSVAYITTEKLRYNFFTGPDVAQGTGSGFIWDKAGHVVTNFHVIAGADTVFIQLDSGDPMPARVVGGAADYDIAVVKFRNPPPGLQPLPLGTSQTLQVGQAAYAIGNPFGLSRTLTTGIVSALERRMPTSQGREVRGVIQTDAAINPGNSGGPLLDSSGRLIGVNTAILSESGSSAGIGFAIPVDLVNRVVPQIIKDGRAPRPGIGIVAADERVAVRLGIRGVIVLGVDKGSPAAAAGIRPFNLETGKLGDIIVAVDGKPIEDLSDLVAALDNAGVGKEVVLTVQRDNVKQDLKVRVIDLQG